MDFLNRAQTQLTDLFKSLTPGARMTAALLLVVTVVSVAYLFNQQVAGPDLYLMDGQMFSATQMRDMEAAFGKANLAGHQSESGRIKVPRAQQAAYMAALVDAGALPPDYGDFMKKAVSTNGFLTSRVQQEAAMKIAKQNELQLIISHLKGIDKAAVQISEEVKRGFREKSLITASVSVETRGGQALDDNQVSSIRNLVAGAVGAGLRPEAITVVDLSNSRTFAGNGNHDAQGGSAIGNYADYKKKYEADWQQTISDVLSYIPGVLVKTNVELDPDAVNEKTMTEYGIKVVAAGRDPGRDHFLERSLFGGKPAAAATDSEPANHDLTPIEQHKSVPTSQTHVVTAGHTPKRVTVSVAVPSSYYEKIWHKQHPGAIGEAVQRPDVASMSEIQATEKKKIEELVATLLPKPDKTGDVHPLVMVSSFDQFSEPPLPQPAFQDHALSWLGQNWRILGMSGLALVSLIMLRSMVKSVSGGSPAPSTDEALELAGALSLVAEDLPEEASADASEFKRHAAQAPSLRDELADMVRADPAAAAGILRTWIGNAS